MVFPQFGHEEFPKMAIKNCHCPHSSRMVNRGLEPHREENIEEG